MQELTGIQFAAIAALPLLFAITVHEVAHGWVARRLGDPTALMLGRLTLNPIKHIDPVGTVLVPGFLLLVGGFIFGWAKPVPITWQNLKNPKRDMTFVALAGPLANLLMALLWALIAKLGLFLGVAGQAWFAVPMMQMGKIGITMNALIMVLNLLPIPPLDGGRVLTGVLPGPWAWQVGRLEPYGFIILLGLLVTGVLANLLAPPVYAVEKLMYGLVGL